MKKILMGLIVLLALIIPNTKVYALEDSFYEGEYIQGEYIKKFIDGSGKYEQMRFFRRKSDNKAVYCIQLWETLSSNKNLVGYDSSQADYAEISDEVWNRIMLIAYYGYGYNGHTADKWYAITQFMIWNATSPSTNLYFTDTLNGSQISKYNKEMNEINTLIFKHYQLPSFSNREYQVSYNQPMTLKDTNHVLTKFEFSPTNQLSLAKNGDNITVSSTTSGTSQATLVNKGTLYSNEPIVYIDNNGQNLLAAGNYGPIYARFSVTLPSADLVVNLFDINNRSCKPQGEAKLAGAVLQLLDQNGNVVGEREVPNDCTVNFDNLGYGDYKLREVKSGEGYLLNEAVVSFEVDENLEPIVYYNRVKTNQVNIYKYLKNTVTGEESLESGAVFGVFDRYKNRYGEITTNDSGFGSITLPYGSYTIKQEVGYDNYLYVDDIDLKVVNYPETHVFKLYDEIVTAKLNITNIDFDSKLPILESGATFKIKDMSTGQYLLDEDGNHLILKTDAFGNTDTILLTCGEYEIEQISAVYGYRVNTSTFKVSFDKNTSFETQDGSNHLEVKVENEKLKSQIEINRYIEYYFNDLLVNTVLDNNISLKLYAKEDIYSKDGIRIYKKDEEIEIINLEDDSLLTSSLVFGTYYLRFNDEDIFITLDSEELKQVELIDQVFDYEQIITVPDTDSMDILSSNISIILLGVGYVLVKKKFI